MELNKEVILQKIKELEAQFEQAKNNVHAINGAIQLAKHLLQMLEAPVQKLEEATKEEVEKLLGK